jgi:hypothetical protein
VLPDDRADAGLRRRRGRTRWQAITGEAACLDGDGGTFAAVVPQPRIAGLRGNTSVSG